MASLTINLVLQKTRTDNPSHVRRLNVCGSALDDITILHNFPNLEVCSLSVNEISNLEVFGTCEHIKELYLRKNKVSDFEQILCLQTNDIKKLSLVENPICAHPRYRPWIIAAMPSLDRLDDVEVTDAERQSASREFPVPRDKIPVCSPDMLASAMAGSSASTPVVTPMPSATSFDVEERANSGSGGGAAPSSHAGTGAGSLPSTPSGPVSRLTPAAERAKAAAEARRRQAARAAQEEDAFSVQQDNFGAPSASSPGRNGYNGDDVPIGAVARGGGTAPQQQRAQRPPPLVNDSRASPHSAMTFDGNVASFDDISAQRPQSSGSFAKPSHAIRPQHQRASPRYTDSASPEMSRPHRDDGVVKAIGLLLQELSPSGIAAVQRQLDQLKR